MQLPYTFDIKNSVTLANELHNIAFDNIIEIFSFDIENMHTKIQEVNNMQLLCINFYSSMSNWLPTRFTKTARYYIDVKVFPVQPKAI
jgi:hypothetical protein